MRQDPLSALDRLLIEDRRRKIPVDALNIRDPVFFQILGHIPSSPMPGDVCLAAGQTCFSAGFTAIIIRMGTLKQARYVQLVNFSPDDIDLDKTGLTQYLLAGVPAWWNW